MNFHMWNSRVYKHVACEISHLEFHVLKYVTREISHVKFHMWNFTCEIPHVKFHMWNFTCEISHVKFHMWRICHMGNTWVLRFTCVIGTSHCESHVNHMGNTSQFSVRAISLIKCMYEGDQTGDTYSTSGRTYVMNARLRWEVSCDRKPRKMSEDRWRLW